MWGRRLPGLFIVLALAGLPASVGRSAANAKIFVPPGVSEAQIVQVPFVLEGSVKVTVSGLLTAIPQVGPNKGKKACYDPFYYTIDCADWKGPGKAAFIAAGPPGCRSATCMTTSLAGMVVHFVFPEYSANHTYQLTLNVKGQGSFWAYPFKGPYEPATWGGGFTLDFGFRGGAPPAVNEPLKVTLSGLQGDVGIKHGGGSFVDAKDSDVLGTADDISTGPDSSVTLKFSDGSTVFVRPLSQISLASLLKQKDNVKVRLNLLMGQIAAKVNKSQTEVPDYSVKTPTAVATVRGTVFSVFYDPSSRVSVVSTKQGLVSVDPVKPGLPTVSIGPGKEVEVTAGAISPLAPIGRAGARGGVNRVTARELVLTVMGSLASRCGFTIPRGTAAFSVAAKAGGWNVSIRVTGGLSGWSLWSVVGRKVTAANALAKKIAGGCPGSSAAKVSPGHYAGTTSAGKGIEFDVTADRKGVGNFRGQSVVTCADSSTWTWTVTFASPVPIQSTLGFSRAYSGPLTTTGSVTNVKVSYSVAGKLDTSGHASGSFQITTMSWDQGGKHFNCTGSASSWTAERSG